MSQTVVNFLTDLTPGAAVNYVIQPRIFDFEISSDSQALYTDIITQLQGSTCRNQRVTTVGNICERTTMD